MNHVDTIIVDYWSGGGTGFMDFSFLPGMTALIAPEVDFTISPATITCAPSVDVTITDNSVGVPDWDFGNGINNNQFHIPYLVAIQV